MRNSDPAGKQNRFSMEILTALHQIIQICRKVGLVKYVEEKHCSEDGEKIKEDVKSRQSCERLFASCFPYATLPVNIVPSVVMS